MVMPHNITTARIAPTTAPTGGDPVGMKKLKVMLYNTSLSGLAVSLGSINLGWLWVYMYVYYDHTLSNSKLRRSQ